MGFLLFLDSGLNEELEETTIPLVGCKLFFSDKPGNLPDTKRYIPNRYNRSKMCIYSVTIRP